MFRRASTRVSALQRRHVHLCHARAIAGERDLVFFERPRRVRMCVLRAVDRVSRIFHPAQILARAREVFRQSVSGCEPLRTLITRSAEADLTPVATSEAGQDRITLL